MEDATENIAEEIVIGFEKFSLDKGSVSMSGYAYVKYEAMGVLQKQWLSIFGKELYFYNND